MKKNIEGITLIALIITIIVLLILAGITVGSLTSNNSVLNQGIKAKNETGENGELEKVRLAVHDAVINASQTVKGLLTTEIVNNGIKGEFGEDAEVEGDGPWVYTGKYKTYEITETGEVGEFTKYVDTTPGVLAENEDGKYMIESIEDLVALSAMTSGGYTNGEISLANNQFNGKTILLMRTLDFNSVFSYNDPETTVYNRFLLGEDNDSITLKQVLTREDLKGFFSIGTSTTNKSFRGTFDGQNFSIKNLYQNGRSLSGLFGEVGAGEVKNITVTGKINSLSNLAGGICARINSSGGTISFINCINYVNIDGVDTQVGGIVGQYYPYGGVIQRCINYGKIHSENNYAGGIVAWIGSWGGGPKIKECINEGEITGGNFAGGISAYIRSGGAVYNSANLSKGTINSNGYSGGINGGYLTSNAGKVYNCFNIGKVIGNKSGGLTGHKCPYSAELYNCFTTSDISGSTNVGYLVGEISYNSGDSVYNCYYINSPDITKVTGTGSLTGTTGIDRLTSETINALNQYIITNPNELNTTGWSKWELGSDGNPKLNFEITWDKENSKWSNE